MDRKKLLRFSTRTLAYAAVMTALVYVGTLIGFSSAQFYFNLGDSFVLMAAALLDPISAMIAGGLGSFLADLTVYPATMVFTLVIKGIEGLVAGVLFKLVWLFFDRYIRKKPACKAQRTKDKVIKDGARLATDEATDIDQVSAKAEACVDEGKDNALEVDKHADNAALEASEQGEKAEEAKGGDGARVKALKWLLVFGVCLFSTALMMTGYFISQTFFYGTYAAALVALPMDAAQAGISSVLATVLLVACRLERLRFGLFGCDPS